ncbi:MAG: hypothetical protein ACD_73C00820G0001 [uncultured bacterium]|nr:MAG: hypothetical protein ACD_73C00820G0001 [uncultured bacterium]
MILPIQAVSLGRAGKILGPTLGSGYDSCFILVGIIQGVFLKKQAVSQPGLIPPNRIKTQIDSRDKNIFFDRSILVWDNVDGYRHGRTGNGFKG